MTDNDDQGPNENEHVFGSFVDHVENHQVCQAQRIKWG
jgi:hypothetical protein